MEEHLDMTGSNQNISKEIMVQYVASAAVGVMEWWIVNSMPYPAADIAEELWQLLRREQIVNKENLILVIYLTETLMCQILT